MTRLFLAASVAALAIAAPAAAKPGGGHGGGNGGQGPAIQQGGGGGGHRGGGGFAGLRGGGGDRPAMQMQRAPRMSAPRMAAPRFERAPRMAAPRFERTERMAARQNRAERFAARPMRSERMQSRAAERQQLRVNRQAEVRQANRQELRANRAAQAQSRLANREQIRADRQALIQNRMSRQEQTFANPHLRAGGLASRDQARLNRQANLENRIAAHQDFQTSRFAALNMGARSRMLAPSVADQFVGAPVTRVATVAALSSLPPAISDFYPDTPDYYYRYGEGYLYRVNRADNVIASLLPLMAGGYLPGQYLPNYYMSSYVPTYYGFNSFYPDYGNDCYRYGYGVVYETDCYTGLVENVVPLYAGGYGVGQLLPSAYNYYNVPMQYRPLYYDTPDYGYWYAPGAIYQYDRGSSMITSVAALMSPGFTIGQPLPMGYGAYNVPYAYRATYYDTPSAWYRYNNGYIYQVDPATQLVTAIVASILS